MFPNNIIEEYYLILETISSIRYQEVRNEINRLDLLKEEYSTKSYDVDFEYNFEDGNLDKLRKLSDMDAWLDSSSDFDKVKSILSWVNQRVKHRGDLNYPYKNSIELLDIADINNGYLNCRGIAVITNELFLAASLYSKFVICMQKEENIDNYHVLNSVFIKELNKWIMVDPTYFAYFSDSEGEILSIAEVREVLSGNKQLYINDEANYYNEKLILSLYLPSLIKNFYRFESPIISKFHGDISEGLSLIPKNHSYRYTKSIDNPQIFWS